MKKILYLIVTALAMISNNNINAQVNLVPNPSFEELDSCPFYYNQLNRTPNWSSYRNSPDYFNSCNNTFVGVPYNDEGYQFALTGNAYAGFIAYAEFGINAREIIGTQLNQPLVIGQKYYIKFYVNLAIGNIQHTKIASNKLGIRFSTIPYTITNPIPIDNFANIYSDSIITDSLNWVKISDSFIADSAYQYLSVGCFFNDSSTSRIYFDSIAGFAYYFLDDISVSTDSTIDILELEKNTPFRVYPNPIIDWVIIEGKGITSISILDALGREQYLFIPSPSLINKLSFVNLTSGLYFIKIKTEKNIYVEKLFKN